MSYGAPCCSRANCTAPAVGYVGIDAWAIGYPKTERTKARMIVGLAVCSDHFEEVVADTDILLTDEFWTSLQNVFVASGLASPDRATIQVFLAPLDKAPFNARPSA